MKYIDAVVRIVPDSKEFIPVVLDSNGIEIFRGEYYHTDLSCFAVAISRAKHIISRFCPECDSINDKPGICPKCQSRGI